MFDFSLNPELDVSLLSVQYAKKNRIQIQDIYTTNTAQLLYDCLSKQVPWGFAWQEDKKPQFKRAEEVKQWDKAEQERIIKYLSISAQNEFQYAYNSYPILDAYLQKWEQVPLLDEYLEYINSDTMLDFIRKLTGRSDVIKGDAQATRYSAGQYLKFHTDDVKEEFRVCAVVLNLTPQWDPDYGGYLQFYDNKWDIEEALIPRFNTLNVFTVPQRHAVSYVANYCPLPRYAITGWFRYK